MRKFRWLVGGIFSFSVLFSPYFLWAQVGEPFSDQISRRRLAEVWAPTIFQDRSPEFTQAESNFNSIDDLVGLFLDGNQDVRDNAENLFRLSVAQIEHAKQNTPVYFSVIETETHFYINYIFYHALDAGVETHAHDTENILTIIEKDGSSTGRLVAHMTNAHGFGMIYPDADSAQKFWVPDERERKFLPYLDRYSEEHNERAPTEYIQRTESKSFKAFIASKTHAIYKLNSRVWRKLSSGTGIIYISSSSPECLADALTYRNSVRLYTLIDWDSFLETNLVNAQLGTEQKEAFLKIFESLGASIKSSLPHYRARMIPAYLSAGVGEEKPMANLFHSGSLHSPYTLADPASVHAFFENQPKQISKKYLFNIYLNDLHRAVYDPRLTRFIKPLRRASIAHFFSELWEAGSE